MSAADDGEHARDDRAEPVSGALCAAVRAPMRPPCGRRHVVRLDGGSGLQLGWRSGCSRQPAGDGSRPRRHRHGHVFTAGAGDHARLCGHRVAVPDASRCIVGIALGRRGAGRSLVGAGVRLGSAPA